MKTVLRTNVGHVRKINEDAAHTGGGISIVCDGLGGHKAGDVASRLAVDTLCAALSGKPPSVCALRSAVQKANETIFRRAASSGELSGMSTTLTALWMDTDVNIIAQVGDSRAYLFRSGELRQCTHDHSFVADLVRSGVLTREEAQTHPQRNIITRWLGTDTQVAVDIFEISRKNRDRWLLCSDGLTTHVEDSEIDTLMRGESLDGVADALLALALARGGIDNITLILIEDDGGDAL